MQGSGVVNRGGNASFLQSRLEGIAGLFVLEPDYELIVSMPTARDFSGQLQTVIEPGLAKQLAVGFGYLLTRFPPAFEMGQFDGQQSRLQGIETKIAADEMMMILGFGTMSPEHPGLIGQGVVIAGQQTAIAKAAEVLGRKKE